MHYIRSARRVNGIAMHVWPEKTHCVVVLAVVSLENRSPFICGCGMLSLSRFLRLSYTLCSWMFSLSCWPGPGDYVPLTAYPVITEMTSRHPSEEARPCAIFLTFGSTLTALTLNIQLFHSSQCRLIEQKAQGRTPIYSREWKDL